jgi:uncharacterized protein (DUF2147 family)
MPSAKHREPMAALFRSICAALILASVVVVPTRVGAEDPSPLGLWTTIDDDSHKPRAVVEISEHDGVLSGQVVRLFRDPAEDPDPRCEDCAGTRHNQRVLGMTILWNMRRHGETWEGGEILDPEDGSIYRCKLHPVGDGGRLEVRGFIGISLLGRTQTWTRATP